VKVPGTTDLIRDDEREALICDCLEVLLSTLPTEQASIVRAIDLEGALSWSVAVSHRLSLNEATTQLALGRQSLRDRFRDMYMICPQHGLAGCDCYLKAKPET
jgi:DNA-directed RNA polymerase specialized sigma24 family protein